jgi:hypothetical protein
MNLARGTIERTSEAGRDPAVGKRLRRLLCLIVAAAVALPTVSALAQDTGGGGGGGNPLMPKFQLGGEQKRKLTPEEQEQQTKIDADYKAANNKIPNRKAPDPWGDVRQAPSGAGQKTSSSTPNAPAQKKKTSAQQAQ